jgi:hypothetical protein
VTVPDVTGVPMVVPPCDTVKVTVPTFTVPAPLVTVADNVTFWLLLLKTAEAFAPVVVVEPAPTVSVCVLSVLALRFPVPLYAAVIVYVPAAVFAGNTNVAPAAPDVTVPDVTGVPIVVPPCETVNVTVPVFTAPEALVTVADNATFWLLLLKAAEAFAAVVVVAPGLTVRVWVLSLLPVKFNVPL